MVNYSLTQAILKQFRIKIILSIFLFLSLTTISQAASVTASLDKTSYNSNDNIRLEIKLIDAKLTKKVNFASHLEDYKIIGTQKSVNSSFINGKQRAYVTWVLTLKPRYDGVLTIPSIIFHTNYGILKTESFTIKIKKNKLSNTANNKQISIKASLNNYSPMLNETLIYKVVITRPKSIANQELIAPTATGALIEQISEAKNYQKTINGVNAEVTEISYAINPLEIGKMVINPAIFKGAFPVRNQVNSHDPFDSFFSFNSSFTNYQEFSIAANKMSLTVKDNKSLLPLENLTLKQKIIESNFKVGSPINLTLTLTGSNINAKRLPDLKFPESDLFKIYYETPNYKSEFKNKKLIGIKNQKITLIPLQEGEVTIPEISIEWFNVKTNKTDKSTTPETMISVKPTNIITNNIATESKENLPQNNYIFIIIAFATGIIIPLIIGVIFLLIRKQKNAKQPNKEKPQKLQIDELKNIESAAEIKDFILKYFAEKYDLKTTSLNQLAKKIMQNFMHQELEKLIEFFTVIEAALYSKESSFSYDVAPIIRISKEISPKIKNASKKNLKLNPY